MSQDGPRLYGVMGKKRAPLVQWMRDALEGCGCRVIKASDPYHAPFRITFEAPTGERLGIVAYAFLANSKVTLNRPADEHRFQIKYGPDDGELHELWQDPYGLYTTLLLGINPEQGFFVAADPVLRNPTQFYISLEFKQAHVERMLGRGWHAWERDRRDAEDPVEIIVGGTARSFLQYIRFEREALGEDQGHRHQLAERAMQPAVGLSANQAGPAVATPSPARIHQLAAEFEMSESEVLDLIGEARMLKMAVRGLVAERHLVRELQAVRGVTDCRRLDEDGSPDVQLSFEGSRPIFVECKNALRVTTADNRIRVDFQRTRASKTDPCSRYYAPDDFDVVAACAHAVTGSWQFRYHAASTLPPHAKCAGKLSSNVKLGPDWDLPIQEVLRAVARR